MATNNMNNLTTLIKRLEAATSRLEDIASSAVNFDSSPQQNGVPQAAAAGSASAPPSAPSAPPAPQPPKAAALPPSVEAFDSLINNEVNTWVNLSKKLGGVVAEQASAVIDAFAAERNYLLVATKAKKPEMGSNAYMELLKDLQKALSSADELRQVNRASPFKDHLAMVADGLGALGWIQADSKPADLLMDLFGGAQLYGNKVLKEYKEKDPAQVEWVQAFYKIFKSLQALVKQHYLGGVTWNKDGIDATEALKQVKAGGSSGAPAPPPPGGAGGPPPPPPPPPLPTFDQLPPPPPPKGNAAGDMGAVFEQLNRGEAVTSGLRKVDASQMTHKNPALRASSTVPERKGSTDSIGRSKSPAPPGKKPKPESMRTKKPPKKELDGQKWIIDNFDSPSSIVEIEANLTQSVLISRCKNTTIRINGKANAISVDNSSRLSLILDSLVSSVDVIKCPNFALQILGTVPTILLDQVDGATLYLSKDSLSTEVFTSKCSSVNVTLPPDTEDGDYKECPAPEQIRSYVKDGQLVSEIVEHAG